jgi:hypothetical protein
MAPPSIWEQDVGGSNPLAPTKFKFREWFGFRITPGRVRSVGQCDVGQQWSNLLLPVGFRATRGIDDQSGELGLGSRVSELDRPPGSY